MPKGQTHQTALLGAACGETVVGHSSGCQLDRALKCVGNGNKQRGTNDTVKMLCVYATGETTLKTSFLD
ncbi:hypothetical protein DPMN_174683 [Dreissena polymorpha]|uniref:Uncharacterized protein n=1 Tax=Dreissena polymorpha TaxID=45954 RepID=A0A9D4E6S9_DREPO|nr:hypothetical protein DPMN_174683 [Dreissena polymorpha]